MGNSDKSKSIESSTRFKNEMRALYYTIAARAEFSQSSVYYVLYRNVLQQDEFEKYSEAVLNNLRTRFECRLLSTKDADVRILRVDLKRK